MALLMQGDMTQAKTRSSVNQAIQDAVDLLLRERLAPYGYDHVEVAVGEDHDGDEVLRIDVYHRLSETPIDSRVVYSLRQSVRELLDELGEERHPLIRHHFHEDQTVAGWR